MYRITRKNLILHELLLHEILSVNAYRIGHLCIYVCRYFALNRIISISYRTDGGSSYMTYHNSIQYGYVITDSDTGEHISTHFSSSRTEARGDQNS